LPAFIFTGTLHAREWACTMTTMWIADQFVENNTIDPRIAAVLDSAEVFVFPVQNPDGYEYTWATGGNRLWRKNRRNNGDGSFGVDLNRNWAFQWGGGGASTIPADETYRGPSAFSEPESAALRDYFVRETSLAGHIDFHAYSQLILSPWGYTTTLPSNNAAFLALGSEMRASIARTTGASYTAGPIATTLYIASGSSVDHAYGAHGVPSYTIEVRDTGSYGFVMPASESCRMRARILRRRLISRMRRSMARCFDFLRVRPRHSNTTAYARSRLKRARCVARSARIP
jgi:murein tripeptide amidase MpaA